MVFVRLDLTFEPNNLTYMYSHLYLRIKSNYRILLNGTYVIYIYNIFWVIKNFWFWHLTQRTRHTCILILYLRINSHYRIVVLSNGTYIYTYFWYNISKLLAFGGILLHTIVNYDKYDVVKWLKSKVIKQEACFFFVRVELTHLTKTLVVRPLCNTSMYFLGVYLFCNL